MEKIILSMLMSLSPRAAARMIEPDLIPICRRESRCKPIRYHKIDGRFAKKVWENAVARGLLTPDTCEHHAWGNGRWSTSGPYGMMRAYTVPYMPGCYDKRELDIPVVATLAARARLAAARKQRALPALKRWATHKINRLQ